MLHRNPFIIDPKTFDLIVQLHSIEELKGFHLVGGTSLALQIGHRNSIDIDLFSKDDFQPEDLEQILSSRFEFKATLFKKNTVLAVVNNIKTDFIKHNYPLILPPIEEEGISYLSKEDIAAMKIHAIIQSGKRIKDFIDIYFLLEYFSIGKIIDFFTQKYTYSNPMIAYKAITFFDDIDPQIDPPKLLKPLKIEKIKKRILEAMQKPSKIFK